VAGGTTLALGDSLPMLRSLATLALLAVIGISVALILNARPPARHEAPPSALPPIPAESVQPQTAPEAQVALGPSPPDCRGAGRFEQAASDNAASLTQLAWSPLGVAETGWETYAPLIAHEIGSACPPSSPAFAEKLAGWQGPHGQIADGRMNQSSFMAMYRIWHARRPFSRVDPRFCPNPPAAADLAALPANERYGKDIVLRRDALAAFERMRAAALSEDPQLKADPRLLTVYSGYRDPMGELVSCVTSGSCDNRRKTWCSAHRTGTAMDLYLGQAPGFGPDSTSAESRLYLSRTPAYRWLVANASRFGFVNYVYEPWHWEWAGDPARPTSY